MTARRYEPNRTNSHDGNSYTEEQLRRWLGWLAYDMRSRNDTELWLHECVGPSRFRALVKTAIGLVFGVAFAVAFGITFGVIKGLLVGLLLGAAMRQAVGPVPAYRKQTPRVLDRLASGLRMGLLVGLIFGLLVGLSTGLARASHGLGARVREGVTAGLFIGIITGIVVGLIFVLLRLGNGSELRRAAPRSPTQLLTNSGKIGLIFGLISALVIALPLGLTVSLAKGSNPGMKFGLEVALMVGGPLGLIFGIDCLVFHYLFRLWLRIKHHAPLRYVRFLNWASAHLLLRSTGCSYEWAHIELREYLATRYASNTSDGQGVKADRAS
jgi:hypothetical protein